MFAVVIFFVITCGYLSFYLSFEYTFCCQCMFIESAAARPKLKLLPRTVKDPVNTVVHTERNASIFGKGKPRDPSPRKYIIIRNFVVLCGTGKLVSYAARNS
jgi:hypothetical protein